MTIQYTNIELNGKKAIIGETELNDSAPVNLLIGFHGADSTPENMLIHGNRLSLKNTIMLYPEGPVDAGKGLWSWWADGPRQKEAVKTFLDYTKETIEQSRQYLSNKVSKDRLCLWGFSQGGAASLVYTLLGSHPLYKVASVCGFLPELPEGDLPKNSPTTILGIYGANDDVVPSFLADHALEEMKGHGHHLTARETDQGHEVNAQNLQELSTFFAD